MAVRRRSRETTPIEVRAFSCAEAERGIVKLRRRVADVSGLDPETVQFDDARVTTIESNIRASILEIFGQNSAEFREHEGHHIWHGPINVMDADPARQQKFVAGIPQTLAMLGGLISRLEEKRDDALPDVLPVGSALRPRSSSRSVFVVHGRDEACKGEVVRFLSALELDPIVLHEQPNQGRTVIEKFEESADVAFAVVLLTPDDIGRPADDSSPDRPRARQNVIFELGYFTARLDRSRVCALYKGDVEILSDYEGVIYVSMDDSQGWKFKLAREMKAAGIEVDLNLAV